METVTDTRAVLAIFATFAVFYVTLVWILVINCLEIFDDMVCGTNNTFRQIKRVAIALVVFYAMVFVWINNPFVFNFRMTAGT